MESSTCGCPAMDNLQLSITKRIKYLLRQLFVTEVDIRVLNPMENVKINAIHIDCSLLLKSNEFNTVAFCLVIDNCDYFITIWYVVAILRQLNCT